MLDNGGQADIGSGDLANAFENGGQIADRDPFLQQGLQHALDGRGRDD